MAIVTFGPDASPRIVEIGDKPFVRRAFPDRTLFFSTGGFDDEADLRGPRGQALSTLWHALHDPAVALVVCHPTYFAPWHWQAITRAVFNRRLLERPFPPVRALGPQLLRAHLGLPLAVVDHEDLPFINRNNLFLLRRATAYFKRELPPDRWRLLAKTAHPNLPTPRFRERSAWGPLLDKLRPISLGLPLTHDVAAPVPRATKTVDIFFAGQLSHRSSVRQRGVAELLSLRARGLTVVVQDKPLPRDVFLRQCAAAWLTWSPEGLGWDCFRHYEAAVCGSVPLINQPTIERHAPLVEGEHALYYDVEPGGLTRAVLRAVTDRERLSRIGEQARSHVLTHHTARAIASYVVQTTLPAFASLPL